MGIPIARAGCGSPQRPQTTLLPQTQKKVGVGEGEQQYIADGPHIQSHDINEVAHVALRGHPTNQLRAGKGGVKGHVVRPEHTRTCSTNAQSLNASNKPQLAQADDEGDRR